MSELLTKALAGTITGQEVDQFRGHMLVEMARMSQEDGLVMQVHCGVFRNHKPVTLPAIGADKGAGHSTESRIRSQTFVRC